MKGLCIVIKGTIQQDDMLIINIHASDSLSHTQQILLEGEIPVQKR